MRRVQNIGIDLCSRFYVAEQVLKELEGESCEWMYMLIIITRPMSTAWLVMARIRARPFVLRELR
jgi:hypothetical protein